MLLGAKTTYFHVAINFSIIIIKVIRSPVACTTSYLEILNLHFNLKMCYIKIEIQVYVQISCLMKIHDHRDIYWMLICRADPLL